MRTPTKAFFGILMAIGVATAAHANPADLDPTFGSGGSLTSIFAGDFSRAEGIVIQPDGRIVAAGFDANADFALARVDATGALDASFGTGGVVTTDFAGGADAARGLVLQPDGMLIAAGTTSGGATALARYQTDGTLDPGFGVGGRVVTAGLSTRALVLQPDGMTVVGGYGASGFMLARYDASGALDPGFGSGGIAATSFVDSDGRPVTLFGLTLQPDGKIVAVGGGGWVFALARFDAGGTLDPTFGTGGKVTTDVHVSPSTTGSQAYDALVQPDGKLVLVGGTTGLADTGDGFPVPIGAALMLRYDGAGALDATFNSTGKVTLSAAFPFTPARAVRAVALQPDDRLVAIGTSYFRKRVNSDGSVDGTFSSSQNLDGEAFDLALQSDGKLVAAGQSPSASGFVFEIVRFGAGDCGDGTTDPGEECDDANGINGDGCDNNCTVTACGNHIVTAGEDCEPALSFCCTPSCTFASAGTSCPGIAAGCAIRECDGAGACTNVNRPKPTCVAAATKKSTIQLDDLADGIARTIKWSWQGVPVAFGSLPDPVHTRYDVCVFDRTAGVPYLATRVTLGNPFCPACWKTKSTGYDFNQTKGNGYNPMKVTLKASKTNKGTFKLKTNGFALPIGMTQPLDVDPKVTVQLETESGDCWTADFTVPLKNDDTTYKAKSD